MTDAFEEDKVEQFKKRANELISASDLEGLTALDREIRDYLQAVGEVASRHRSQRVEELEALLELYQGLSARLESLRGQLASEVRSLKSNQKGIKAYQDGR